MREYGACLSLLDVEFQFRLDEQGFSHGVAVFGFCRLFLGHGQVYSKPVGGPSNFRLQGQVLLGPAQVLGGQVWKAFSLLPDPLFLRLREFCELLTMSVLPCLSAFSALPEARRSFELHGQL